MIRPALLVLLACLTASPAAAHWDRTRWGMTPEAVKALYPAAEDRVAPEFRAPGRTVFTLEEPYVYDGQTFDRARLFFRDQGRLDRVEFSILTRADRVPPLMTWLDQRYGAPVSTEGPASPPASGAEIYKAEYRASDGDRVTFLVLWADGQGLVSLAWEPPAG